MPTLNQEEPSYSTMDTEGDTEVDTEVDTTATLLTTVAATDGQMMGLMNAVTDNNGPYAGPTPSRHPACTTRRTARTAQTYTGMLMWSM